jgi:hypothetical protein
LIESIPVLGSFTEPLTAKLLSENAKAGDSIAFRHTFYKILSEVVKATSQALNQGIVVLYENVVVGATFVLGTIYKVLAETIKVIPEYIKSWTLSRIYSETISVISGAFNQGGKIFAEALSVSSEYIRGLVSKLFEEIVKVYDSIEKSLPRVFSESVSVIGQGFNQGAKIFSESVSVVGEFILGTISKLFAEPLIVAYQFVAGGTFYKLFEEGISVIGNTFNEGARIFAETVSVSWSFTVNSISKLLSEVVAVGDLFYKATARTFTELVSVISSAYSGSGRVFTGTINIIGAMTGFAIGKLLSASIIVGESLTRDVARTFEEIVVVAANLANSAQRVFSEIISVVNPTIIKDMGKTFTEIVVAGWAKIKLVLNGIQVGLWKKIARKSGSWRKVSRNDTL